MRKGAAACMTAIMSLWCCRYSSAVGLDAAKVVQAVAALNSADSVTAGQLDQIDQGYLHRNEKSRLEDSTTKLRSLLNSQRPNPVLLWRLGRNLIAVAGLKPSKKEKLAVLSDAESVLNQAVQLSPGNPQAHFWLAQEMASANDLLRTLKLARSMKKELETAISLDPKYPQAHRVYGELMRQLPRFFGGDDSRAVKENEEALRLAPNDTANYPSLAEAYRSVNRKDDAVRVLKKIFAVQTPEDPGAYEDDMKDARNLLKRLTGSSS